MARVVRGACSLFRMVASMYNPRSVKAKGSLVLPPFMRVSKKYLAPSIYSYPYWRLKSNIRFYKGVFCLFGHPHPYHSVLVNQIIYSCGNFPGFRVTASFIRLVSTPYSSATSESRITGVFRKVIILFSTCSKLMVFIAHNFNRPFHFHNLRIFFHKPMQSLLLNQIGRGDIYSNTNGNTFAFAWTALG